MTEITFKSIADKYNIYEENVESIFFCYDTNDMEGMKAQIGYCFFGMKAHQERDFLFDIIRYIKQCQLEVMEEDNTC